MPRQRIDYNIPTYNFPDDFPERLKRYQVESGLSWSEIARRWKEGRGRPNTEHMMALLDLVEGLGLAHLLIA